MRSSRHVLLRSGTADVHAALERAVEAQGYFDSLPRYRDYLARMRAFHRRLEVAAGPSRELLYRWSIDRHAQWLDEDLVAVDGRAAWPPPLPAPSPAPWHLSSTAQVVGALYVVIGSSLGSRLLVRRASSLGLPHGRGCSYLEGLSRNNDWPAFLATLAATEAASDDDDDLVAGARATFAAVYNHLAESATA